ncbi:MAG TPA: response regulator [Burkholderiaceae bacterium]|jgi:CheY-like chemotaxis protein|nr:response regulator [Burkholderiaceae bacterium]
MAQQTILVVEDEYGSAEVLQLVLEIEGYRVLLASNGREALDLMAQHRPDLVLTDFMMPIMSGAQLGAALRERPATSPIAIVMMSAAEESVVRRQFRDYNAFLRKPFSVEALLPVVRKLVSTPRLTGT